VEHLNRIARTVLILLALTPAASPCFAQTGKPPDGPPPPAKNGSEKAREFVSLQGRFTISLPEQVSGYRDISANVPEGRIEGDSFNWMTPEGYFEVSYIDLPGALATKAVFDRSRDNKLRLNRKAKLAGESDITLDGNPGRETRFETPDGILIVRTYLAGSRLYEAAVALTNSLKSKESEAVRALDSLRLLPQSAVDAARRKEMADATPSPLPQAAAASRLKSDAEDEGLKGRVKTVFRETQDLSGTWSVGGRKPSAMDYYDEKGQLTKQETYDYKGNLFQVAVYGYVDGARVRSDQMIHHEYDPPPVMVAGGPGGAGQKSDPRYSYKFGYRYDERGRLAEKVSYDSGGKIWLRYVYKFEGNKREESVYSEDGSLNQRYVYTLDDKGNEVEKTGYDVKDGSASERYTYVYEFDAKGNWSKRTTSQFVTKEGKSSFVPSYVTFRTIAYY
jgi:hypothetical protein